MKSSLKFPRLSPKNTNDYFSHSTIFKKCVCIMKTCLYNFDPLNPHFYIVKLYTLFFLFLLKNIYMYCGYSLEPPRQDNSNKYPQSMFLSRNKKKISEYLSENFHFLVVKFSVYLNRHVFVMCRLD